MTEARALGKADLHIHTSMTDGMASVQEILEHVQNHTDLDVIAITDHDTFRAADLAVERWGKGSYRFDLVPGMEVTTLQGHLLALFLDRPVPSYKSLSATIEAVHRRGGLCIVPHAMSWLVLSLGERALRNIIRKKDAVLYLDAIELLSPTPASAVTRAKATRLNDTLLCLPVTGGSDAHFLSQVGGAITLFPGKGALAMKQAIQGGLTTAKMMPGKHRRGYLQEPWTRLMLQQARALILHPVRLMGGSLSKRDGRRREDEDRIRLSV